MIVFENTGEIDIRHGWKDCTRELQNYLFEKLVSVGEELVGEPL